MVFSCLVMYHGARFLGHSGGVCPVHIVAYGVPMYWRKTEIVNIFVKIEILLPHCNMYYSFNMVQIPG